MPKDQVMPTLSFHRPRVSFSSDAHQALIDSVLFPEQIENVSYGRMPNGFGDFTFLSPTFEQTNDGANLIPLADALVFNLYPNPVLDVLYFEIESQLILRFKL